MSICGEITMPGGDNMTVQIVCVPVNGGFLTLVWPGGKHTAPREGEVRIFHANVMDLIGDGRVEEPECLNVNGGVTYWQAAWKGEI